MPKVGIEPTIPMFEREETIYDLDSAATTVGPKISSSKYARRSVKLS
jgi:hypothetical protein